MVGCIFDPGEYGDHTTSLAAGEHVTVSGSLGNVPNMDYVAPLDWTSSFFCLLRGAWSSKILAETCQKPNTEFGIIAMHHMYHFVNN